MLFRSPEHTGTFAEIEPESKGRESVEARLSLHQSYPSSLCSMLFHSFTKQSTASCTCVLYTWPTNKYHLPFLLLQEHVTWTVDLDKTMDNGSHPLESFPRCVCICVCVCACVCVFVCDVKHTFCPSFSTLRSSMSVAFVLPGLVAISCISTQRAPQQIKTTITLLHTNSGLLMCVWSRFKFRIANVCVV